jgi:ABC-type glutathione transport system ATPase component
MRQRVMIAMALALPAGLLIADEPTTALDVTIQAQILDADPHAAGRDCGMAVMFITHDHGRRRRDRRHRGRVMHGEQGRRKARRAIFARRARPTRDAARRGAALGALAAEGGARRRPTSGASAPSSGDAS